MPDEYKIWDFLYKHLYKQKEENQFISYSSSSYLSF